VSAKFENRAGSLLVACSGAFPSAESDNRAAFDATDFRAQNFARIDGIFGCEWLRWFGRGALERWSSGTNQLS
jgi:hypothetical protein